MKNSKMNRREWFSLSILALTGFAVVAALQEPPKQLKTFNLQPRWACFYKGACFPNEAFHNVDRISTPDSVLLSQISVDTAHVPDDLELKWVKFRWEDGTIETVPALFRKNDMGHIYALKA